MMLQNLLNEYNITLSGMAQYIEIPDDFEDNTEIKFVEEGKLKITCQAEDITREVSLDLKEKTITVSFESDIYSGAEVYDFEGKMIKIVN